MTCADYPQPFRLTDPIAEQTRELTAARAKVVSSATDNFAPFTTDEVLSPDTACIGWPAPSSPPPPSHAPFPKVPTLVMEGSLDTITPPSGARAVTTEFPRARYIEMPNLGHVTALSDDSQCAAGIAATFLATGKVDTSCIPRIPAPATVDAFPTRLADEAPAVPALEQESAGMSVGDLRTVAVVRDAISDVLWRWGRVGILSGHGLRGGTFQADGPLARDNVVLQLQGIRWTADTQISGDLHVSPNSNAVTGSITLTTPGASVHLDLQSNLYGNATVMTVTGTLSGHKIDLLIADPLGL